MKKFRLLASVMLISTMAAAQIGEGNIFIGGGLNLTVYSFDNVKPVPGGNLRAGVNFTENFGGAIDFNQSLAVNDELSEVVYPYAGGLFLTTTSTYKLFYTKATIRGNFFFSGTADDDFASYSHVDLGILTYRKKLVKSTYDPNAYYSADKDEKPISILFGGGYGFQYRGDIVTYFGELNFVVPIVHKDRPIYKPISNVNLGITAGIKIHFEAIF